MHLRVLELPDNAEAEDIRSAYKRLMHEYHPDKYTAAGKEIQQLAERKSKEINEAYRALQ
jgi:DnaJ-class molecular chaperone